jgi:hypothetical protein
METGSKPKAAPTKGSPSRPAAGPESARTGARRQPYRLGETEANRAFPTGIETESQERLSDAPP